MQKELKLKGKFNIQRNVQCSVIKISSTVIQQVFLGEIQHSIEHSIFNNKNPFNRKFSIQRNIQYSITKINSTAIQRLFSGNSITIQRHHDNI